MSHCCWLVVSHQICSLVFSLNHQTLQISKSHCWWLVAPAIKYVAPPARVSPLQWSILQVHTVQLLTVPWKFILSCTLCILCPENANCPPYYLALYALQVQATLHTFFLLVHTALQVQTTLHTALHSAQCAQQVHTILKCKLPCTLTIEPYNYKLPCTVCIAHYALQVHIIPHTILNTAFRKVDLPVVIYTMYPAPPCIKYWTQCRQECNFCNLSTCNSPVYFPSTILSQSCAPPRWCTLLCVLSDLLFAVLLSASIAHFTVHRPLVAPSPCQLREWVTPP